MSRSHPDPTRAAVEWVASVLPGVLVSESWPDPTPVRFAVVQTVSSSRGSIGFLERWGVTVRTVAPLRDDAMRFASLVAEAARALQEAPDLRQIVTADAVTPFALTGSSVSGPTWQSSEPSVSGPADHAVVTVSVSVRIYPPA